MNKTVSNLLPDSCVIVANRTLMPAGSSGAVAEIPERDLTRWLTKGGQRMLDARMLAIAETGDPVRVEAPSVDFSPTLIFDGTEPGDALQTPDEPGGVMEPFVVETPTPMESESRDVPVEAVISRSRKRKEQ